MKFFYVNGVFNFRFYLCVIQKKNKHTLLINRRNTSKKSPHIPVNCVERKKT
jgi:hypothetical protein